MATSIWDRWISGDAGWEGKASVGQEGCSSDCDYSTVCLRVVEKTGVHNVLTMRKLIVWGGRLVNWHTYSAIPAHMKATSRLIHTNMLFPQLKVKCRAWDMAQQVKALATMPKDPDLITRTHMVAGESQLPYVLIESHLSHEGPASNDHPNIHCWVCLPPGAPPAWNEALLS